MFFKKHNKALCCLIFSMLCCNITIANSKLIELYLQPFSNPIVKKEKKENSSNKLKKVFKLSDSTLHPLGPRTLREHTTSLLSQSDFWKKENKVIDRAVWKSLELFSGAETLQNSLMSKIDSTKTLLGEAVFAKILSEPTTDFNLILKRQSIIRELAQNEALYNEVEKILEIVQQNEENMLRFWEAGSKNSELMDSKVYWSILPKNGFFGKGKNLYKGPRLLK